MTPLELVGVRLDITGNVPVVFLRERGGERRLLPIYIGNPEAASIQWASEGRESPRPLTHDLMVNVFGALGTVLEKVVITDVHEGTFMAEMHLRPRTGSVVVSCRPSDAIAIAVRAGCSIFCESDVLDIAGKIAPLDDDNVDQSNGDEPREVEVADAASNDDLVDEFRDFIDSIKPEDFQP